MEKKTILEKKEGKLEKNEKKREKALWITIVIHSDLGVGKQ
jgi:hypothetical protein